MVAARRSNPDIRWLEVRMEMERNAYHLGRRGSIVAKWASGGRRWVLRFVAPDGQGRVVHRTVYLGSGDASEVLRRARELLGLSLPEIPSWQGCPLVDRSFFRSTVGAEISALHPNGILVTYVIFLSSNLPAQPNAAREALLHPTAHSDPESAAA
jgi:hypothetical protein